MQHTMTVNGKKQLQKELDQLVRVDREQIKKEIAEARAHGDLKENAEYHAAKEKQALMEGRIAELQGKLGNAKIIDPSKLTGSTIFFGATVTIINADNESTSTFQIVGSDEAQNGKDMISYQSPLAKALIGKEAGDEVIVKAPKGEIHYEIEDVCY